MKTCHFVKFDVFFKNPRLLFPNKQTPAQCWGGNKNNKDGYAAAGVAAEVLH